jgi:hypothetical protein
MARAAAGIYHLTRKDAGVVMAMAARGDRDHDVAAWFGVNQGRIAEVKDGSMFGSIQAANNEDLPPSGPIGPKARRMRAAIQYAMNHLDKGETGSAMERLKQAADIFDSND